MFVRMYVCILLYTYRTASLYVSEYDPYLRFLLRYNLLVSQGGWFIHTSPVEASSNLTMNNVLMLLIKAFGSTFPGKSSSLQCYLVPCMGIDTPILSQLGISNNFND